MHGSCVGLSVVYVELDFWNLDSLRIVVWRSRTGLSLEISL